MRQPSGFQAGNSYTGNMACMYWKDFLGMPETINYWGMDQVLLNASECWDIRADSRFVTSQWETSLQQKRRLSLAGHTPVISPGYELMLLYRLDLQERLKLRMCVPWSHVCHYVRIVMLSFRCLITRLWYHYHQYSGNIAVLQSTIDFSCLHYLVICVICWPVDLKCLWLTWAPPAIVLTCSIGRGFKYWSGSLVSSQTRWWLAW